LTAASHLLEQAKAGDPQAFQALVRPHIDSIRRFARSFCKNAADADDLAQEALLKAYRSFSTFDERSALSTWLYTIAKHQFLDYRRSKLFHWRKREGELDETAQSRDASPECLTHEHQQGQLLWSLIGRIDEKFRTPLVLAEIEGLDYEAIAQVEQIPLGTVRSRISRAKEQLRSLLETHGVPKQQAISGTSTVRTTSHRTTRDSR
jgi:RNA polymerase sigma-70 factor (ECF subfamily)